ncbi:permease YjgP/YjgQ family protein [Bathymodiolus heckerae thiotrophic gill symbiont]|uniref:LPS export ABC transporter permease LptG n=1 Tax=Bathymodiolus heckerae thiotrophic gill symbiont TaxID=1052212 RepID=UPI0010B1FFCC|nr:LPS export ABC transporter permease LptG [Bathymodiolus heckerae thiotrophic gill symbiont]SMN13510.1 permease YjgP/YjgQ family protein [Bathymodiolus heckerae thiotrophic gill symbiont]
MKILDRYLAKTLLFYTLTVMTVWVGIYALFNFINEIDVIGQQNYTLLSAVIYVAADLPAVIYSHSSVIILLGCLLGLGHLAATSQLVVIRGCGASIVQIAQKVVSIALMFIFVVILLGEFIAPMSTQYSDLYKAKALGGSVSTSSQKGFWLKNGNTIINVKKNFDSRVFGGVTLIQLDKNHQLEAALYADKAIFDGKHLTLENTKHYQLNQTEKFTDIQLKNQQKYSTEVSFNQTAIEALEKDPRDLSSWELYQHIGFLADNNLTSQAFEVELYKRAIKPVTLIAMLLLSMLFIFGSLRDATLGKKIFLGVVISLFFELSSRIGSVISLRFDYDPLFSVSAPTLVVLAIALFLLKKKSAG